MLQSLPDTVNGGKNHFKIPITWVQSEADISGIHL